jgi:hypothetical protein
VISPPPRGTVHKPLDTVLAFAFGEASELLHTLAERCDDDGTIRLDPATRDRLRDVGGRLR